MPEVGYELRIGVDAPHGGVFATRAFDEAETVMVDVPGCRTASNHSHANQVSPTEWVLEDGLNAMVNHSCDPNCGVRPSGKVDGFAFVARRPIATGEEITFDYAMRNYVIEHFPAVCLCATTECRGLISGWKNLPASRKAIYGELVAPYLLELDRELAIDASSAV